MSSNDNEHPAARPARQILDAELDRIFAAGRAGEITPQQKNAAPDHLARKTVSLAPGASVEDVRAVLSTGEYK